MTREHKLALVVGFGLILFVGILVSDHLAADARGHDGLPSARIEVEAPGITLAARDSSVPLTPAPVREAKPTSVRVQPEIYHAPREGLARPFAPVPSDDRGSLSSDTLAGRGIMTPPAPRDRTHRVARGETLSGIAKAVYGDPTQWMRIAEANPGINPNRLRPGTSLRIPARDTVASVRPAAREVPAVTPRSTTRDYTVQRGDSLARIARRQLGKESRWREIARLNGLPNEVVVPGQILTLPVS